LYGLLSVFSDKLTVNMPFIDMLGPPQASSSAAAVAFDADNAGASGEVGRLQGIIFGTFICFSQY